jgi:hypothetical protein
MYWAGDIITTITSFHDVLDLPSWRPLANAPNVATAGVSLACDLRNNEDRHPEIFQLASAAIFNKYSVKNDEWLPLATPALAGTFGAGTDCILVPEQGPSGTIAAGGTTTSFTLTTALPAAVGQGQLSNRGDGIGFKIKVVFNSAGGRGLTEIREIVNNTLGTTPTLYFDDAFSQSPALGDRYEFLSGRVFLLNAGAIAAGTFRWYDIATNSYSTLAQANLPATITTDSHLLTLSELYVPYDRKPGEGFLVGTATYDGGRFSCLQATNSAAGTLTGQAAGGDAGVLLNEYRNHQLRIVEDIAIPTAVGQRRKISSHTAGALPQYTLSANWAPTPSINAKYVLEGDGDKILLWTTANVNTYTYTIAGNAWDVNTTFATRVTADGAGLYAARCFGIEPRAEKLTRHSYVYMLRGAAQNQLDIFDIAGAATGLWTENITYGNKSQTFTTGNCGAYDPISNQGKIFYIYVNGTQRFQRNNMDDQITVPWCFLPYVQGAATAGRKIALTSYFDGDTKLTFIIVQRQASAEVFQCLIQR